MKGGDCGRNSPACGFTAAAHFPFAGQGLLRHRRVPASDRSRCFMTAVPKLGFGSFTAPQKGVLIVLADDSLSLGSATRKALGKAADLVQRAARAERFTGKPGSSLDLLLPA